MDWVGTQCHHGARSKKAAHHSDTKEEESIPRLAETGQFSISLSRTLRDMYGVWQCGGEEGIWAMTVVLGAYFEGLPAVTVLLSWFS